MRLKTARKLSVESSTRSRTKIRNQRRLKKERKAKWMIGRLLNSRTKIQNRVVRGEGKIMEAKGTKKEN